MKRGQVTLFIIIAILIIAGIFLFFIVKNNSKPNRSIPSNIIPIHNFIQECLKQTSEEALITIGNQGGYRSLSNELSIENQIPYYLQNSQTDVPNKQKIEKNLEEFISAEMRFCILNFENFINEFDLDHELNAISSKILKDEVLFTMSYPTFISKKESETIYQLEKFEVKIPVRLHTIHQVLQRVLEEQLVHPEEICLNCLYSLGQQYNVNIEMTDHDTSTIFTVIDNYSKINEENYKWNFAIK